MAMSNKKWFTLIELVIAIGIIGIWLIAVFVVLNSWFATMAQARWHVMAINLAREWSEIMFNLRDTNLHKRSGKKDLCWLNAKGVYALDPEKCEDELWIGYYFGGSGISYAPLLAQYGASKVPLVVAAPWTQLNIFDGIDSNDSKYELMVTSSGEFAPAPTFSGAIVSGWCVGLDNTLSLVSLTTWCQEISYSPAGRFYRVINNVWLYDKDAAVSGGNNMQCTNGGALDTISSLPCGTSKAKELRFCSEVQYIVDSAMRKVTMCSLMTNFKE